MDHSANGETDQGRLAITLWIALLLACLSGCRTQVIDAGPSPADNGKAPPRLSPSTILRNMPLNSDQRCMGICLVAEALLDGEMVLDEDCDSPDQLGREIYDSARTGLLVRFHANLCWNGEKRPIDSRESLEQLSTAVADHFKNQWFQLVATEQGKQKLLAAQRDFLDTAAELDQILEADADKTVTLFLVGIREFPDGSLKDTAHAVLLGKAASGDRVLYDPNDPGAPIPCRLESATAGLTMEWTCQYRDTGQVTHQSYLICRKQAFFRLMWEK